MSTGTLHVRRILCLRDRLRAIEVLTMPDVTSIVFVVDDDVSVRESLELLIRTAGWRPKRLRRRRNFCPAPASPFPAVWCSM